MKRYFGLVTLSALVFVAAASVASAGGWAVVTLDAMPTGVVVNAPVTVGMVVRQHGKTPMTDANVNVRGFKSTGDSFEVTARNDGGGHYSADLTFNKPGTWQWQVASGLYPDWQMMPAIEVADSVQDKVLLANANTSTSTTAAMPNLQTMGDTMLLLAMGVLGIVVSAGGLTYWWGREGLGRRSK